MDQRLKAIETRLEALEINLKALCDHIYHKRVSQAESNPVKEFIQGFRLPCTQIPASELYGYFRSVYPDTPLTEIKFVKELLQLYPEIRKLRARPLGLPGASRINVLDFSLMRGR
jgi:hypothetical protein